MAHELRGRKSTFTYDSSGNGELWRTSAEQFADLQLRLPDGARVTWIDIWYTDSHASEDLGFYVVERCAPFLGAAETTTNLVNNIQTSGSPGAGVRQIAITHPRIDNRLCRYYVRVRFGSVASAPTPALVLHKVRVQWSRQLMPAPATPTFTDVPAANPFYRSIEALVKSGITSGCGGGKFCPGTPVTRAQMAAFLAGALGLNPVP